MPSSKIKPKKKKRVGEDEILNYQGIAPEIVKTVNRFADDIITLLKANYGKDGFNEQAVRDAIAFATFAHQRLAETSSRKSGRAYIFHPLEVAQLAARHGLDDLTVIAAVLHDVYEDCRNGLEKRYNKSADEIIIEWFGKNVFNIIDSLTKIKTNFEQELKDKLETYRKILEFASRRDIRALVVKIFDRLNNIREIGPLPQEKRFRICEETLTIYVPIARTLNMHEIADEMVERALPYIYPEKFKLYARRIRSYQRKHTKELNQIIDTVNERLSSIGIHADLKIEWPSAAEFYEPHAATNFQERFNPNKEFVPIIQGIFAERMQIYSALGVIHSLYRLAPGKLKDTIADPFGGPIRAVETTVIVRNSFITFRLLTPDLLEENRKGILYNWSHKVNNLGPYYNRLVAYLRELVEGEELELENFGELAVEMGAQKSGFIHVFTPRKDYYQLPKGATVLDFAYLLHREIGNHCESADVNGYNRPPYHRLEDGDVVHIKRNMKIKPRPEWEGWVITPRAKQAIKRELRRQRLERARFFGRQIFESHLRRFLGVADVAKFVASDNFREVLQDENLTEDEFFLRIGTNQINLVAFIKKHFRSDIKQEKGLLPKAKKILRKEPASTIIIANPADSYIKFAPCCNPIAGEDAIGLLPQTPDSSETEGIVLHLHSCPHVRGRKPEQLVQVAWDLPTVIPVAHFFVRTEDRTGVLADVLAVTRELHINIVQHNAETIGSEAFLIFDLAVGTLNTLLKAGRKIRKIDGVIEVRWVYPENVAAT